MNINKVIIILMVTLIIGLPLIYAVNLRVQGHVDGSNLYGVFRMTSVNATQLYQDSNLVLDTTNLASLNITGNMNASSKNITNVHCIMFSSGGSICTN